MDLDRKWILEMLVDRKISLEKAWASLNATDDSVDNKKHLKQVDDDDNIKNFLLLECFKEFNDIKKFRKLIKVCGCLKMAINFR